ncbi:hypothetical protein CRUP_037873, partial [Coryphaenoides rupestris]
MANLSYRFSVYNINEALNQKEGVDLDSLMADLCSIEQELNTVNTKTSNTMTRLGLTDTKVCQKPPAGRSTRTGPAGGGGGGGGSGGSSTSSSARVSPAGTASLSMDEAARQSSSHSLGSTSSTGWSAPMRGQRQHRRTGSVGTVSEHEVRLLAHSSRSSVASASGVSVNSASSMDSLDGVLRCTQSDGDRRSSAAPRPEAADQRQASTE